jgi:hypothetical protein
MRQYLVFAILGLTVLTATAQQSQTTQSNDYRAKEWYFSQEGEMIFSFASFDVPDGSNVEQNMRWSPVFNIAGHANYDISNNFGLNIGFGVRNVGFIAKTDVEGVEIDRVKYRTYNLGIPIGFKIGDLNQKKPFFLFAGYEFELPIHYKQKEFDGSDKVNKITGWFSDRSADFHNSLYAGIQFPQGVSLKFKYYLTEFFDPDFTQTVDGVQIRPFENFNANVFYFSITAYPFRDLKSYKNEF